ncbi:MAG: transketolase [Actinomycetes bacterium]|jgi:transketolase
MLPNSPAQIELWKAFRKEISQSDAAHTRSMILEQSRLARREILAMIQSAGMGHVGGDFSVIDILTTLYFAELNIDPSNAAKENRDWFILSKGHCAAAFYATLAYSGYFDPHELSTFMQPMSMLNGHPSKGKISGIETSTGPLGHGLPIAVGIAIAAKIQKQEQRTFVVLGDGELQEGTNWEAAMTASQYKLSNLIVIIDRNRLQQGAGTEDTNGLDPLDKKWESFGWDVQVVDGHEPLELLDAIRGQKSDRPRCIIANTVKGKGVSFMENRAEWHHKVPSVEQNGAALEELLG